VGRLIASNTTAWITVVCGAFVMMMSKFESLAELTIGPLKAKTREVVEESLRVQLNTTRNALATLQAAQKLPPSPSTSDVIATTTNTAVEAVTAAIRANDVMFTAWRPSPARLVSVQPPRPYRPQGS
jgi:hypothetical protein